MRICRQARFSFSRKIIKTHQESLAIVSDDIVHNCISGKLDFEDKKQATVVPLYTVFKTNRFSFKNISTTMVNPYEYIGYRKQ